MDSKLEEFRQNAADCRQLAVAAPSAFAKQHWLAMTTYWMKLAVAEEAASKHGAAPPVIATEAPTPFVPARTVLQVVQ
jgi:hypothetical protein